MSETFNVHDPQLLNVCEREYVTCQGTMGEIAERHGLSSRTLTDWSSKRGWHELRNEWIKRERERMLGPTPSQPNVPSEAVIIPPDHQVLPDPRNLAKRYRRLGEKLLEHAEALIDEASGMKNGQRVALLKVATSMIESGRECCGIPRIAPIKPQREKSIESATLVDAKIEPKSS